MLEFVSCKYNKNKKDEVYIYVGKWVSHYDNETYSHFRFAKANSNNLLKTDYNKLSGLEGDLTIATKSGLNFEIEDFVFYQDIKYTIKEISYDEKEGGELAQAMYKQSSNIPIYLKLRRAGK